MGKFKVSDLPVTIRPQVGQKETLALQVVPWPGPTGCGANTCDGLNSHILPPHDAVSLGRAELHELKKLLEGALRVVEDAARPKSKPKPKSKAK